MISPSPRALKPSIDVNMYLNDSPTYGLGVSSALQTHTSNFLFNISVRIANKLLKPDMFGRESLVFFPKPTPPHILLHPKQWGVHLYSATGQNPRTIFDFSLTHTFHIPTQQVTLTGRTFKVYPEHSSSTPSLKVPASRSPASCTRDDPTTVF